MKVERMNLTSLRAFFGKLVRMSFYDLGKERDTQVASYLANVLSNFVETEKLYKIRDSESGKVQSVVDMILEAQSGFQESSHWERELRKYIGDFTLFMTGIFRDYVIRGSYLHYYIKEGTRSYFLVSKLDIEAGNGNPIMFSKLSSEFEFYSGALDYMRKVYFQSGTSGDTFSDFVSQISKVIKH
ncbi:MAG: hypothetical protein L0Y68_00515 [Candidatus Dadabacteria bacterium]|nr:hypothetical protein [Candidatus Dadabacteria bacterium]